MKPVFDPCRLIGRLFYLLVSLLLAFGVARAVPPLTTTVSDVVYRADGSAASGTLLITWSQFSTPDNKAVAAGTMNVAITSGGVVNVALAPNVGATPAGSFYKVIYKLDDGTSSTEYWTVPATSPTTISAIRSTVVPASMAVQVVSRSYVDSSLALKATDNAVVHKAGDSMTGALTLSADPTASLQAATKSYVDTHAGGSVPGQITVDGVNFPTIHSAIVAAGTTGSVLIPANYSGTDTDPNPNKIQVIDLRGKPNRQRGYINVLTDCGLKGTGNPADDDAAAAQACLNAYPSWTFWFPPTKNDGSCSYWFTATLKPTGEATTITGGAAGFKNDYTTQGGTVLCWAAGVTGVELDLTGQNCSGCNIRDISLQGSEGTHHLVTPTELNLTSGANLPLFTRNISSIQRTSNVLTVTVSKANGGEGLTQQVGSTVKIAGVVGDATMNGLCTVSTLSGFTSYGGNPVTFTCPQNGADAGPFTSDGKTMLPTTGASTADGIRICTNFATINHVVVVNFGRHGINADSSAADGMCPTPFSDDLVLRESVLMGNQGDGYLCNGNDCNAQLLSGNAVYYNVLWGLEDQSSLGNTHVGNQLSNGGHLWASSAVPTTKPISSISRTGGTVSVVLSTPDTNVKLGSCVVIAGVSDSSFNSTAGQCFFINSFTDSTHYSYIQPGAPANASSSGGTARMAKFAEAYLSAGVDDGAQKIQTQAGFSPILINQYAEGGQGCKWGNNTIMLGGANTPSCSGGGDWTGQFINTQVTGLGGQLSLSAPNFIQNKEFTGESNLRAGITLDKQYWLTWLNHSNSRAWLVIGDPSGTLGGSGLWGVQSGNGQTRLQLFGKDTNNGDTYLNGEGAGAVNFGKNYAGTNAGSGGVAFWSGGASPTRVGSVDSAGVATMASFKSGAANPASSGTLRLAKTDAVNFRNNANTADVVALSLNASDQALLPTLANLTSAGNVTAPAFVSNSGNPASAGSVRLAQVDGVKFRNNANAADLNVLSESSDVLQVGEATNGINVPGPANFSSVTASGAVTGASIATGGDSFAGTPRIAWGSFLPGALSSTWTAAQFTPKKAINVVQIDLRAKAGPAGCTTFPVVQITDGTTPINVTLNAAGVSQSVAGGQNYAANATVQVKVSTAGVGCTTAASDVNVTVQYKMQ